MEPGFFEFLISRLYELSGLLCHQLETRCISVAGVPLPVCSRCSGIYAGAFLSLVTFCISSQWFVRMPLTKPIWVTMGAVLLFLLFDVYIGFRLYGDIHGVRFATGYMTGFMMVVIIISLYQKLVTRESKLSVNPRKNIFYPLVMMAGLFVMMFLYIIFHDQAWFFHVAVIMIFSGVVIIYSAANTVMFFWVFDKLRHRCLSGLHFALALLIGTALFIIQLLFIHWSGLTI